MELKNENEIVDENTLAEGQLETEDATEAVTTPQYEEPKELKEEKNQGDIVDELGVVSENTTIIGDISTKGHLAINGQVKGNIVANGNVVISGKVEGDITCDNLKLSNCTVSTNSSVKHNVIIEENSKLNGNISCDKISVDGVVNGDINAGQAIDIFKNATVKGDIKTTTLAVEAGAQLQGNIAMEK